MNANAIRFRSGTLDSLRGLTLVSMMAYHACWDLVYLYGMPWDWYRSFWAYAWQQSICWVFILLSGFCLPLGHHPFRRGAVVFGAGALVTAVTLLFLPEDTELAIRTNAGRMLLVNTAQIAAKTTRDSQGVAVVTLKKNQTIASVVPAETLELANPHRYRVRSLPATGALIRAEDEGEQLTML
mgnify:CR=1 FL=1